MLIFWVVAALAAEAQDAAAERIALDLSQTRPNVQICVPVLKTVTPKQVRALIEEDLDLLPEGFLDLAERVEVGLGVLPPDRDMRQSLTEMYGQALAGFFSPTTNIMYVQRQLSAEELDITLAHELVHCQQHATWNLVPIGDVVVGQNDATQAKHLWVEGDAELTRMALSGDPAKMTDADWQPILEGWLGLPVEVPEHQVWINEAVLGYSLVAQTVNQLYGTGGWGAVDAVYTQLPESTEQLLHLDKLLSREKPLPVTIDLAKAARVWPGVSPSFEDNLGEARLLAMFMTLTDVDDARQCAAGWGGDRLVLFDNGQPMPSLLGMIIWDTEEDAKQAERCLTLWFQARLPNNATLERRGDRIVYLTGRTEQASLKRAWRAFE